MSHNDTGDPSDAGVRVSAGTPPTPQPTPPPEQARPDVAPQGSRPAPVLASDRLPDIPCVNWRERGTVSYAGQHHAVHGRALALVLWIAHHQDRVNESRAQAGQLFATWKGGNFVSISGHVKVRF